MLKFFPSGILVSALISLIAPQAPLITAIVADLALAATGIEWQGKRQGSRRGAKKALPAMKIRKV